MANWQSDQIQVTLGTFTGGLGGAPKKLRSSILTGKLRYAEFTFKQGTTATVALNDTIDMAYLKPTDRIIFGRFYNSALGAGATFSIGRVDSNNSANNSATQYKNAVSVAAAGTFDLDLNLPSEVGVDPAGDGSTGNQIPNFGGGKVTIQGTFGGAAPAGASTINGFVLYVEE